MTEAPARSAKPPAAAAVAAARARVRRSTPRPPDPPADVLPVARVCVDVGLAHLDRLFDYAVLEPQSSVAVPGCRVKVRFAGQEVAGFVLERAATTDHVGPLTPLRRVVSAEPVLAPQVARLARAVADRYAGTLSDVLRLAVPPRHARVEKEEIRATPPSGLTPPPASPTGSGPWARYDAGPAFLAAVRRGGEARAVCSALPGDDWPHLIAHAVAAATEARRGALVVVPDGRDVQRVAEALADAVGPQSFTALTAELGPTERYRRWLAVRRGHVRAVVGTRAAMFAPVADLGLVVVWDDGDDLHAEPRAPYPHVREVLLLRSVHEGAAVLLAGHARTAEAQLLLDTGWARPVVAPREVVRSAMPRIVVAGDDAELARDAAAATARLPTLAWETARRALASGPVLVQVPRRGYLPALTCAACRAPARCELCAGPLALPAPGADAVCRWCRQPAPAWACPVCEGHALRAPIVGERRTAEELGRAFPLTPVRTSGRDGVLARVGPEPALVVATPGAEPVADGGYAAALLLDGWALLGRADLRASEEALRRWLAAAALVRPAADGGAVIVMADPGSPAVQALVRWDPATAAERELADRRALRFPPAVRAAVLTGSAAGIREVVDAGLPPVTQQLGPVPTGGPDGQQRLVLRVPLADGNALATALRTAQALRSARKSGEPLQVQVDPVALG